MSFCKGGADLLGEPGGYLHGGEQAAGKMLFSSLSLLIYFTSEIFLIIVWSVF